MEKLGARGLGGEGGEGGEGNKMHCGLCENGE